MGLTQNSIKRVLLVIKQLQDFWNMEFEGELNLYDIPLMGLRPSTRQLIINDLNKKKVLASEEGLPRDWRGLLHLTGLPTPSGENPAAQLLAAWERDPAASLGQLEQYLGQLDRWDIVDDVRHLIRADAKEFVSRMTDGPHNNTATVPEVDDRVLTYDDISRLERGMQLQMYDALLLYADQDQEFASQMVDRLENDYDLKVCLKECLVGGLSFEHQGIMRLISERCRRVIIIVSRSFVNSSVNKFFVTFAQALAIEQRRRIIIPCMYERDHITLPMEIHYLHKLDYNRIGLKHYNFWEQLRASVADPPALPEPRNSSVIVREISNSTLIPPSVQRALEPAAEPAVKPSERTVRSASVTVDLQPEKLEKTKAMTKSSDNLLSLSENICSNKLSNASQKFSCSSLNVSEKNNKAKSPKEFFRKLFQTDTKHAKKSKKIAVRL